MLMENRWKDHPGTYLHLNSYLIHILDYKMLMVQAVYPFVIKDNVVAGKLWC